MEFSFFAVCELNFDSCGPCVRQIVRLTLRPLVSLDNRGCLLILVTQNFTRKKNRISLEFLFNRDFLTFALLRRRTWSRNEGSVFGLNLKLQSLPVEVVDTNRNLVVCCFGSQENISLMATCVFVYCQRLHWWLFLSIHISGLEESTQILFLKISIFTQKKDAYRPKNLIFQMSTKENPAKSISDSVFRKAKDSNRKTARKSQKDIICVSQQKDLKIEKERKKKCVNFVSVTHKFPEY